MGVDVAAVVERYRERTAGRTIDDPNAYLFAMAREAVAKRVGTTRQVLAIVASDRATLAGPIASGTMARAQAEGREALARQLGGGDMAAGYAALAMIPDSPHRKSRSAVPGTPRSEAAVPSPAPDGAMQLGALLRTFGITRGATGSTAGGV
jgi:hypothetical protein